MAEAKPDEGAEPSEEPEPEARQGDPRRRYTTAFGWLAGGLLGLMLNYGAFLVIGEGYPVVPTTFVLFVAGAFSGMALADRLGGKGFKALGITAGVLVALFVVLLVLVLTSPPPEAP